MLNIVISGNICCVFVLCIIFVQVSNACPQKPCYLMDCPYGYTYDDQGCPLCQCLHPCSEVDCAKGETCIVEEIHCIRAPCLPQAVCVKREDVCDTSVADEIMKCGMNPDSLPCPPMHTCEFPTQMSLDGICCAISEELSPCVKLRQEGIAYLDLELGDIHQYVPKCANNGLFDNVQCQYSKGECWCVHAQGGTEIAGTRISIGKQEFYPAYIGDVHHQKPACGPCHRQQQQDQYARLSCRDDGYYDSTQCGGTECWCVDPKTGEEIVATRSHMKQFEQQPMC